MVTGKARYGRSPKRKRGSDGTDGSSVNVNRIQERFSAVLLDDGGSSGAGIGAGGISPLHLRGHAAGHPNAGGVVSPTLNHYGRMPESANHLTPSMGSSFISPTGADTPGAGSFASSDGVPSPSDLSADISPHSLLGSSLGSSFGARPRSDLGYTRASRTINDRSKQRSSSRRKSRRKTRRRNSDGDQPQRGDRHAPKPIVASHSIIDPASSSSSSRTSSADHSTASGSSTNHTFNSASAPGSDARLGRFNPSASHPPRHPGGTDASPMRSHSTPRAPKRVGRSIYEGKSRSAGRVLPDQSAFLESEGLGDSHASHASRGDATTGKKQCPPTPQRTPTWLTHSHGGGAGGLAHSRREEAGDVGDSLDGLDGFVLNHFNKGAADAAMDTEAGGRDDSGSLSASDLIGLDDDDDDNLRPSPRRPRFASHSGVRSPPMSGGKQSDDADHEIQSEMPAAGGKDAAGARSFPASVVRHRRRRSLRRNDNNGDGNLARANEDDGGFGYYVNEAGASADAKHMASPLRGAFAGNSGAEDDSMDLDDSADRIDLRGGNRAGRASGSNVDSLRGGSGGGGGSGSDDDFSKQLDFENDGSSDNNVSPGRGGRSGVGAESGKKGFADRGRSGATSSSSSHRRGRGENRRGVGPVLSSSSGGGMCLGGHSGWPFSPQ